MGNRVTVAIPVFNGMPHVKAAVESVLAQTYKDLDVVVIDNASTDDTVAEIKKIDDSRLRFIINEHNVGLEGNWNKALMQASNSPYFKLVCADDLLRPTAIAREVDILDRHPEVVMTASQRAIIDDNDKTIIKARGLSGLQGVVDGPTAIRRSIAMGTNIIGEPTGVLLRSSSLENIGEFDGEFQYLIDFDMWARVLRRGKLYAIKEPLATFRVGVLSNSGAIAKKQRAHHVGEFRKIAATPGSTIGKTTLYAGIAMATFVTTARRVFYRLLSIRQQFTPKASV